MKEKFTKVGNSTIQNWVDDDEPWQHIPVALTARRMAQLMGQKPVQLPQQLPASQHTPPVERAPGDPETPSRE